MTALTIAPAQLDLSIYGGATWTPTFTCTRLNTDGTVLGLYDFTGCSAKMELRDGPGLTVRDTLSSAVTGLGANRIVLGGTAGTLQMIFPDDTSAAYTFASSNYDLLVTDASGNTTPFFRGTFTVQPGLTNSV